MRRRPEMEMFAQRGGGKPPSWVSPKVEPKAGAGGEGVVNRWKQKGLWWNVKRAWGASGVGGVCHDLRALQQKREHARRTWGEVE